MQYQPRRPRLRDRSSHAPLTAIIRTVLAAVPPRAPGREPGGSPVSRPGWALGRMVQICWDIERRLGDHPRRVRVASRRKRHAPNASLFELSPAGFKLKPTSPLSSIGASTMHMPSAGDRAGPDRLFRLWVCAGRFVRGVAVGDCARGAGRAGESQRSGTTTS
jgi:hypothetical protein